MTRKITQHDAAIIKKLLIAGYFQHEIAALFSVNQGLISEINKGKRYSDVPPAA